MVSRLLPWDQGGSNAAVVGEWGWVYKNDIEVYGISLSKEISGISVGMDIVYREDLPLAVNFLPALTVRPGQGVSTWSSNGSNSPDAASNPYPGATGKPGTW